MPAEKMDTEETTVQKAGEAVETSAAERAAPASSRAADFGIDTTARTTGEAAALAAAPRTTVVVGPFDSEADFAP